MSMKNNLRQIAISILIALSLSASSFAMDNVERRDKEREALQKRFEWWPTDAQPAPVKDEERGGYWWWPTIPGKMTPWGNRGYVYVYKIIYDYKAEELPPPQPQELRQALLIRKIIKNVKVYFDYNKSELREDAEAILANAVKLLNKNPETSILITGNCDIRGSETYNEKLGRERAEMVRSFISKNGIPEERVKIISRGKLDAVAPLADLVGMQKDRNAHFVIAEVEEAMLPVPEAEKMEEARPVEEGKYIIEKEEQVASEVKVSQKEYVIQPNDSLWKIAKRELGSGYRWKYLYELNKDRIKDPNKLKAGKKIIIPVE